MIDWISIDDKLPECDKKFGTSKVVLACDFVGKIGFAIYTNGEGILNNKGWFSAGGVGDDSYIITHWTELNIPKEVTK